MKQIFDWLREQIREAEYNHALYGTDFAVNTEKAIDIIDEAEAKWEKDCCEWKKYESDIIFPYKTSCGHSEVFYDTFKFCPYCGKRIKISEVE